ncbi:uncharacterized protein METZ01_LOCUS97013 [marine metagenome]|uniref:Uncharacterized protein n=1 Tax=marine metagenome TaxID=408172 RepID=A0A381VV23_9ZZZZ|tara:strand:+ start:439 stop:720 length:282 start_codon:yes stop_codon:yes gene_type:complete
MDKAIEDKLYDTDNDVNLTKIITNYIGNICDKCGLESEDEPLRFVISFDKKYGNYRFYDLPKADYKLKKFCRKCCQSKASAAPIYIEINDSNK